jgi:hypothetical protein
MKFEMFLLIEEKITIKIAKYIEIAHAVSMPAAPTGISI